MARPINPDRSPKSAETRRRMSEARKRYFARVRIALELMERGVC